MTEEDTFKKLRQVPFEHVLEEFISTDILFEGNAREFLTQRGWDSIPFFTMVRNLPRNKLDEI